MISAAYGAEISSGMATSLSKGASTAGADFHRLSQRSLLKARLTALLAWRYLRLHALRSTYWLWVEWAGLSQVEEKAMSQNIGHEHIRTSSQSYGPMSPHEQRELIHRVRTRLYGGANACGHKAEVISHNPMSALQADLRA